jgi:hypothetical protein
LLDKSIKNHLSSPQTWKLAFQYSIWFTRGWTLQELVAPTSVEFFSKEGERLGNKNLLVQEIHEATGISLQALKGCHLSQFSVDERMSWTKNRETKREEDAAYCLLGIFNVHMPLIYGEGREKAFIRLQKEIKAPLESHILPRDTVNEDNIQNRERSLNSVRSGAVFNGSRSGRYAISGTHVAGGGIVNINVGENATAKRRCSEDYPTSHSKRARVTHRSHRDQDPQQYRRSHKGGLDDNDGSGSNSDESGTEDDDEDGLEDDDECGPEESDVGGLEESDESSSEGSEVDSLEDGEEVDPESERDSLLGLS